MMDFRSLIKNGVHFGHQKLRFCSKMAPYIWGYRGGIHLIDVSKTATLLENAAQFLEKIAGEGKTIIWIGTKKPAQQAIKEAADALQMPFVINRFVGGTFSNFWQVKKSTTKLAHIEDALSRADQAYYTKKEYSVLEKTKDRLEKIVGGIRKMSWPVGAIVVVDVVKEQSAVKEAARMGIPVVALVDTNGDPSLVDYVIPSNDDNPNAIKLIVDYLTAATLRGKDEYKKKKESGVTEEVTTDVVMHGADGITQMILQEDTEEKDSKSGSGTARPRRAPSRNTARKPTSR